MKPNRDYRIFNRIGGRLAPHLMLLGWLIWLVLLPAISATGSTGGLVSLPLPKPRKPGPPPKPDPRAMTMTVDTTWTDCNGYRPVRLKITPTPPLPVDRTITVVFKPYHYSGQPLITFSQDIEVPANATSVNAVLSVPQWEPWITYSLDVYDDGIPAPDLSVPRHSFNFATANNVWGDGSSPNILFLGSTKDATPIFLALGRGQESAIQMELPPVTQGVGGQANAIPIVRKNNNKFAGMTGIPSHRDLPKRWIDYSGLDVVYVSMPDLKDFIKHHPEQWQAIHRWALTGGNLWVADTGAEWQRLPELAKLLELSRPPLGDAADPDVLAGWRKPDPRMRNELVNGADHQLAYANPMVSSPMGMPAPTAPAVPPPLAEIESQFALSQVGADEDSASKEAPFVMRSLGLGQVVAFAQRDPLAADSGIHWPWVFNSVTPERWQWYLRHGVSFQRDNEDFWNFLIPGVGLAPVTQFQVLISFFVLVIGPLNFVVLRRWHKLNLLVITVPVSALAITTCLLLYALLSDGLGTRVRARSLTHIDQRTGDAVCWTRLSYYAGLSPSQGLAFPHDTAVYPLDNKAQGGRYTDRTMRSIDWRDNQDLTKGWIGARTPSQLVTVTARKSSYRLLVRESTAAAPHVENQLATDITRLLLIDSNGKLFEAANLSQGSKAAVKPLNSSQGVNPLMPFFRDNALQTPVGYNPGRYGLFGMQSNVGYATYSPNLTSPTQTQSLLERELARVCSGNISGLPPRSYVAIVEKSPEMSFGLESASPEASFHVLVGKW